MSDLTALISRVRQLLNDPELKRYTDDVLTCAIRQALELIDIRLPQTVITGITVETSGRDQALDDLTGCLYMISVVYPSPSTAESRA